MESVMSKSNQQLMADLFMAALHANDEHLNALAAELLVRSGHGAMPRLIQEACDRCNRPAHRLRLLEVIDRLGPPFGEGYFDLDHLLRDRGMVARRLRVDEGNSKPEW